MKKFYRTVLSISLLAMLVGGLVFMLTGCAGLFNQAPIANIATTPSPPEVAVDEDIRFDAGDSYHPDPDGTIASYDWDWGDPSSNDTGMVQTHSYSNQGNYIVKLTVADDNGCSDSTTVQVDVD